MGLLFYSWTSSGNFVLKSRIPQEPLLGNEFLVPATPDALFLEVVGAGCDVGSVPYCVLCLLNSEMLHFECGKQRGLSLGITLPRHSRPSQRWCFFHLLLVLRVFCLLCCRIRRPSTSVVPNLFGTRDQFHGAIFPWTGGGGDVFNNSSALHLLCSLFLLFLHKLHLRS